MKVQQACIMSNVIKCMNELADKEAKYQFLHWLKDYAFRIATSYIEPPDALLPYTMKNMAKMLGQKIYTTNLCKNCEQRPVMEPTPYCEVCRDEMEEHFQELFYDDEQNPPFICGV